MQGRPRAARSALHPNLVEMESTARGAPKRVLGQNSDSRPLAALGARPAFAARRFFAARSCAVSACRRHAPSAATGMPGSAGPQCTSIFTASGCHGARSAPARISAGAWSRFRSSTIVVSWWGSCVRSAADCRAQMPEKPPNSGSGRSGALQSRRTRCAAASAHPAAKYACPPRTVSFVGGTRTVHPVMLAATATIPTGSCPAGTLPRARAPAAAAHRCTHTTR